MIDFLVAKRIGSTENLNSRRIYLSISLISGIGILLYFKYLLFFANVFGYDNLSLTMRVLTPIGISYYIFKSLSYTMGVYREEIEIEKSLLDYLLYVSFFTNIIAGPISLAKNLLPQIKSELQITSKNLNAGFFLILTGIIKKYVIADYIGINFVERIFESPNIFTAFENLVAVYGATIQLYCDFSGYTDIVLGLSLLMGFTIEPNFNKPFMATSITDFWRRWHITIYTWLREFVFTPLSFSLRNLKTSGILLSIMITFLVSGLWHGANFTFIIWGLVHGFFICSDIVLKNFWEKVQKIVPERIFNFAAIFVTFNIVVFSFALFRSPDLYTAGLIFERIFTSFSFHPAAAWFEVYSGPAIMMIFAMIAFYLPEKFYAVLQSYFSDLHWSIKTASIAIIIYIAFQFFSAESLPFIYLEF
ncbi:MAG: MBOAT family protein [Ignavibacteriaceae bacterium]|nr:MBOAT family protein [Ignavibacteriaceae bacterium]